MHLWYNVTIVNVIALVHQTAYQYEGVEDGTGITKEGERMLEGNLLQMLKESRYTTALSGYIMLLESGYPAIRDGDASYDIEQKYGYSMEEMFSSAFYSTRKEKFYKFYRDELLSQLEKPPGKGFTGMAELERRGLIQCIITRRIFGLPRKAGCKNVIDLHGNVYDNFCPHCGRTYPMEYIRDSDRVPLCEHCKTPVRPRVCLFGEMVDNSVITRAAEEIQRADVLLVLGTNMKSYLCSQLTDYYEGKKLILVNETPHYSDRYADIVIHERVDDWIEKIQRELGDWRHE